MVLYKQAQNSFKNTRRANVTTISNQCMHDQPLLNLYTLNGVGDRG